MLLPTLLLAIAATALAAVILLAGTVFGPRRTSLVKQMPYESGMDPIHDARRRFDVRFHLVALTFLVFDVELLFLYPWAVANRVWLRASHVSADLAAAAQSAHVSPHLVFVEVLFFVAILTVGLAYAWRRGVFRW